MKRGKRIFYRSRKLFLRGKHYDLLARAIVRKGKQIYRRGRNILRKLLKKRVGKGRKSIHGSHVRRIRNICMWKCYHHRRGQGNRRVPRMHSRTGCKDSRGGRAIMRAYHRIGGRYQNGPRRRRFPRWR